jgi:hypothetical protein
VPTREIKTVTIRTAAEHRYWAKKAEQLGLRLRRGRTKFPDGSVVWIDRKTEAVAETDEEEEEH